MDSSSTPSVNSSVQASHRLADITGYAIALVTLILPLWVIGQYSSSRTIGEVQPITYQMSKSP